MRVPRLTGPLCLLVVLAVVAAGCGSEDGEGAASGNTAAADGNCVTEATRLVDEYRKPLPLKEPPGSVDVSAMKGKALHVISIVNTPFVQDVMDGFNEAAKTVGATPKFFDSKGNITLANQAMASAIEQKAGGIVLLNIDPKNVAGELDKAKDAGIAVIDANNSDPDEELAPGLFAHVTSDWTQIGRMFAAYMLAETECKLDAEVITTKVIKILVNAQKGTVAEIKRLCPDCKTNVDYMDLATLATSLPRLVQTALTRNPETNYITPMADAFALQVEPAVRQTGKEVPIISHDGTVEALKLIRGGNSLLEATVSTPPPAHFGWAFVDQLGRAVAGQEPGDWAMPNQIVDSTNIGSSEAELFPNYAGFEETFRKAWGMSS